MIQLSDFTPGQEVIISGDRCFLNRKNAVVGKVGRKYVTLKEQGNRQFYVRDTTYGCLVEKRKYGVPSVLYPTEEAYQKAIETVALVRKLRKVFNAPNANKLSYEQLKQIDSIVEGIPVKET